MSLQFILPLIAIIFMTVLRFTKEKELTRVSWDKLAQFMAFLAILSVARFLLYSFEMDVGGLQRYPTLPHEIGDHKWQLGLVFWEDAFFAMPLYFIWKYMSKKYVKIGLTIAISALFAMGHFYQGWSGVIMTLPLPYFVSYNFGKKYGFGTSMIGHVLYDVSTVLLIQMLPFML